VDESQKINWVISILAAAAKSSLFILYPKLKTKEGGARHAELIRPEERISVILGEEAL